MDAETGEAQEDVPQFFTNSYLQCPFSTYIVPFSASKGAPECMCPLSLNAFHAPESHPIKAPPSHPECPLLVKVATSNFPI